MIILQSKAVYIICKSATILNMLSITDSVYWLLYERSYSYNNVWMLSLSWLLKTAVNEIECLMIEATILKRVDWLSEILWCNWSSVRITRSAFLTFKIFSMNCTVNESVLLSDKWFSWASIASLQTLTSVIMCVSEIWTILNLSSFLTFKVSQVSGLSLILLWSILNLAISIFD